MSLLERDTVMVSTDEEGNAVVDLPHTRANNVEGLGRSVNTYYSVGNVVYVDSNLSVALKCTIAGTTSNAELDVSGKTIGDTVTDGSVVWEVVSRDTVAIIDEQRPLKTYTSLEQLGLDNTATIQQVGNAVPYGAILSMEISVNIHTNLVPDDGSSGMLTVLCGSSVGNHKAFYYNDGTGTKSYFGNYSAYMPDNFKWKKVATNGALSMPSSRYVNVNVTANGTYTVPADGWLVFTAMPQPNAGNLIEIYGGGFGCFVAKTSSSALEDGNFKSFAIPYKKGDILTFVYATLVTSGYKFVYAQSEV